MTDYSDQTSVFFPPKIKRHLRPFYPYLEKNHSTTHAIEHRATKEPHGIKLETLKTWLKTCEITHARHCDDRNASAYGKPLWLIDVERSRIVPADNHRYLALSYVWGMAECVSLTLDTLEILQQDGSLSTVPLATTIRDAMTLTAQLGHQHLWVDKLCIIQDDMEEKRSQIEAMRAIYAGAYLTVVAAQGEDASQSLFGGHIDDRPSEPICVQRVLRNGNTKQLFDSRCDKTNENGEIARPLAETAHEMFTEVAGDDFETLFSQNRGIIDELIGGMSYEDDPYSPHGVTPPNHKNVDQLKAALDNFGPRTWQWYIGDGIMQRLAMELTQSTWYSRGWTFQEFLFSPRRLVFHGNTVNWDCHCASWHENQRHITAQPCSREDRNFDIDGTAWPNMYRLVRLICLFNCRFLTRQEDVLDAFEGPLLSFRSVFHSGFIAGLPQMFFDAALLWQPYSALTRREHSNSWSTLEPILPSWSWVGWQGNLHSESWLACFDYVIQTNSWSGAIVPSSTVSTVAWSWSTSPNSEKRSIEVSAEEFRKKYSNGQEPLPEGWSKEGGVFWWHLEHESQPSQYLLPDTTQIFNYPIPIGNFDSEPSLSIRAGFLHGRTHCATLTVGNLLRGIPLVRHGCVTATLMTGSSTDPVAGYLRLNEDPDAVKTEHGEVCELIELSFGSLTNRYGHRESLDWEGGENFLDMKTFFNVMWIEWKDNIAYRKAIGRVRESVWRDVAKTWVHVILG